MTQADDKRRSAFNTFLIVVIALGGCVALAIVLGLLFLGLYLDGTFGTKPILTLVLSLAGVPLSVLAMLFISRKLLARLKEQKSTKENSF